MTGSIGRRALAGAGLAAAAFGVPSRPVKAGQALRIGYQKNGSLVILRRQATLEAVLGPQGVAVAWVEFAAGPPIMEAMNAGAIDFAATGDTPPIFAQAAGVPFVYVGGQPVRGENQAIVVRADGPITTVADLRGRRVAYTRGSSAHNVVVKALAQAGLTPGDVSSVLLQPPDALAAFRSGRVDAWAIWDPFLAMAEADPGTRVLVQATAVAPSNSFFLARRAWGGRSARLVARPARSHKRRRRLGPPASRGAGRDDGGGDRRATGRPARRGPAGPFMRCKPWTNGSSPSSRT